ncbi:hypothetical protein ACGF5C_12765 [Micromonospora sp. NPDC047620]|uniref:hypothetical protein n=1 Tax=Micromonospora sp. NPDC047620 TaxID=3364251 RepID=UPI00371E6005
MTPPADAPLRPPRPATVTIAFWLQLVAVLVLLGLVALVVTQAIQWDGQIDRAVRAVPDADPDEVRGERWSNVVGAVVLGLPALLLALWLAATALPVRRGGNVARILVFVAGGIQLVVCCGQSFAGVLAFPLLLGLGLGFDEPYAEGEYPADGSVDPEADFWAESKFVETLYSESDPFDAVLFPLAGLGVLTVLLLTLAVVLLLALPPAHRWFVPRAAFPAAPLPPAGYAVIPVAYAPPAGPGAYAPQAWTGGHVPPAWPGAYAPLAGPGAYAPPAGPGAHVPPAGSGGPQAAPPGHLICPDPAAHQAASGPGDAETGTADD